VIAVAPEFARLAAMVSRSTIDHLGNAVGLLAGVPFQGIYSSEWAPVQLLGQQAGAVQTSIQVLDSVVPAMWSGVSLQITEGAGVGSYTITQAHPDGSGLTKLFLELAP
jgi:hypothetical protein